MKIYETSATVDDDGRIQIVGVPFAAGTQVELTITPKRAAAEDFTAPWRRVCGEMRGRPGLQNITDEDICEEIDRYRVGQ